MPQLTPSGKSIMFETKRAQQFSDALPIPSVVDGNTLALPFKHDTHKVLTNFGLPMTGWHPMERTYTFPKVQMQFDMYPHAKTTAQKAIQFERGFILNDPRTGKTSAMVAMCHYLATCEDEGAALVIGPLSTITEGNVWRTEIAGMTPGAQIGYLFGKNITGNKRVRHVRKELRKKKHYYIINPAGLAIPAIHELLMKAVADGTITKMLIDESTEFGNPETKVWKAANALSRPLRWFWMATGTPGGPMTVYGQAKMMNPDLVPANMDVWKHRTMYPVTETKWLPKSTAEKHILKALTPAVRVKKRDVWADMPDEIIIPIRAELDPKVESILKHLKDDGAVMVDGQELIPANGGVMAVRRAQISTGCLTLGAKPDADPKDKEDVRRLPMKAKIDTVEYLHKESPTKTVIYCTFKATCDYLKDELESRGYSCAVVNGDVAPAKRGPIFQAFNRPNTLSDPTPDILIAHAKTVSFGVELATLCDKIIFFGVPMISPFLYQQAKERLYSGKQKSERPRIYQVYSLPIELAGFEGLENGVEWQTAMSDKFRDL